KSDIFSSSSSSLSSSEQEDKPHVQLTWGFDRMAHIPHVEERVVTHPHHKATSASTASKPSATAKPGAMVAPPVVSKCDASSKAPAVKPGTNTAVVKSP
ncbi:unnamed protein product, partial [Amoebophrya sp. A25]